MFTSLFKQGALSFVIRLRVGVSQFLQILELRFLFAEVVLVLNPQRLLDD